MGFITDLVTEGWDAAVWNQEYRRFAKHFNAIPCESSEEEECNDDAVKTMTDTLEKVKTGTENIENLDGAAFISSIMSYVSAPLRYTIDPKVRRRIMEELEKEEA